MISFFADNPDLPSEGEKQDLEHGFDCRGFIAYAAEVERFGKGYFDVIVVDGMVRTAWLATKYLKDDGCIFFDNSERWQYNPGFKALAKRVPTN